VTRVGRYAKATARAGQGDPLAAALLRAAALLEDADGCELYVVNRSPNEPDVVWVTEIWASQEALDASLQLPAVRELIPQVLPLIEAGGMERIDVLPVGGVGLGG
jgi:quinol monooxygenase YgiN